MWTAWKQLGTVGAVMGQHGVIMGTVWRHWAIMWGQSEDSVGTDSMGM